MTEAREMELAEIAITAIGKGWNSPEANAYLDLQGEEFRFAKGVRLGWQLRKDFEKSRREQSQVDFLLGGFANV